MFHMISLADCDRTRSCLLLLIPFIIFKYQHFKVFIIKYKIHIVAPVKFDFFNKMATILFSRNI